ncbi:MAG: citramalate synthase [Opitutaceae bacterium]|nr:citramalate synthase [Opitutaceae bacterium]|tara:strand:+ start:11779 stop:13371 length:1593 start_codon:yes stop_codon:yes gene_type:complete
MASDVPILIYDTTLRDGTQGEGISFSATDKILITRKLDQFGIDYIEGGWPGSNPRDMAFFEEVKSVELSHAKVVAFGSTRRSNMKAEDDPQLKLLLDAETSVVTIFGKTWLLHVTDVLRTTPEENLAMIKDSVRFLKDAGREVIYDAEHFYDGYVDSSEYALKTLTAAVEGGADFLVLCDTNGGKLVSEIEAINKDVIEKFGDVPVGVHCHNDSGLGVAVSLAGVGVGATMVQGTMNGYGERNGNANLTSIIPNLILKMGKEANCKANLSELRELSIYIDDLANVRSNIRAPFVGSSSFAHKGGVHANAALKVARSYEHIQPESVGNRQRILISDMSGRSSLMMKAKELGLEVEEKSPEMKSFLDQLKSLEHKGYEYEAADASFKLLLSKFLRHHSPFFTLQGYRVMEGRRDDNQTVVSEATVKIQVEDVTHHCVAESTGPVSALYKALSAALSADFPAINQVELRDFKVRILESENGVDAKTRVFIESSDGEEIWGTVGASDNIVAASLEALLDSLEYKLLKDENVGSE